MLEKVSGKGNFCSFLHSLSLTCFSPLPAFFLLRFQFLFSRFSLSLLTSLSPNFLSSSLISIPFFLMKRRSKSIPLVTCSSSCCSVLINFRIEIKIGKKRFQNLSVLHCNRLTPFLLLQFLGNPFLKKYKFHLFYVLFRIVHLV